MIGILNINFIGDVMLGERFEKFQRGVISQIQNNVDPFEFCKNDLLDSALNVANLECVVSSTSKKSFPFSKFMLIEPNGLNILLENNIRVVNIANNHIFDHGDKAFFETKENLEKKGIKYFGFGKGKAIQSEPVTVVANSKRIGFLGYDLSNTSKKIFEKKKQEILDILGKIKKTEFDILVLSLHWGYEYTEIPTSFMISAAKQFISYGVDIIYGHHPHILQGVTKLNNKIFAPSLGNFIFDDERELNRFTGILNVNIYEKNNIEYLFKPYYINEKYQPCPASKKKKDFEILIDKLEKQIALNTNRIETDEEIIAKSNIGHSSNKKRVRKEILTHFNNYIPFLYPIFKDKIIDKRIKKIFSKI